MKHLRLFEELNELHDETYRRIMDRTADWPWSRNAAGDDPVRRSRAEKMGRVNDLSAERFEARFYEEFPKGTTITVMDSENPENRVELEFSRIKFHSNWSNYTLFFSMPEGGAFRYVNEVELHWSPGSGYAYALDRDADRLGFDGDVKLDDLSRDLIEQMFTFGKEKR